MRYEGAVWRRMALCTVLVLVCLGSDAAEKQQKLKRLSQKKINKLEASANEARVLFEAGDYEGALAVFEELSVDLCVSQPLYLCEMATCLVALGRVEEAQNPLRRAFDMNEGLYDEKSEKKAASLFGAEAQKLYKGDPYERAMLALLLGMLFLNDGQVDNALACFKSGILADSDVANELYKSDFALLQALEAKCYQLRGQQSQFEDCIASATSSFLQTHPRLADLVSEKQVAMLEASELREKAAKKKSKKRAKEDAAIEQITDGVAALDRQIDVLRSNVDSSYVGSLRSGAFNTLLVIWSGDAPEKQRMGRYGEDRVIVLDPPRDNRYEVLVDGAEWLDAVQGVADISFQASTRGGRRMDDVLDSQASFKGVTEDMGDMLVGMSDDVGGVVGLGMLAVGLVSKGVSAVTKVEADIRGWGTLPNSLQVVPLNLEPGEHSVRVAEFHDYLPLSDRIRVFEVHPDRPVNIVMVMSSPDRPCAQSEITSK